MVDFDKAVALLESQAKPDVFAKAFKGNRVLRTIEACVRSKRKHTAAPGNCARMSRDRQVFAGAARLSLCFKPRRPSSSPSRSIDHGLKAVSSTAGRNRVYAKQSKSCSPRRQGC